MSGFTSIAARRHWLIAWLIAAACLGACQKQPATALEASAPVSNPVATDPRISAALPSFDTLVARSGPAVVHLERYRDGPRNLQNCGAAM